MPYAEPIAYSIFATIEPNLPSSPACGKPSPAREDSGGRTARGGKRLASLPRKQGGHLLSRSRSTIGAGGLNFSVRYGQRWVPAAIAAPYAFGNRKTGTTSLIPPEASGQLVPLGFGIAAFAPAAYQRGSLPRPLLGNLISGTASRLDAFSAYPNRAWLPGYAPGGTTGAPEARPSRSSRTKDRPPQVSNARNR